MTVHLNLTLWLIDCQQCWEGYTFPHIEIFPNYKLKIAPTPVDVLIQLYEIASKRLDFVYLGNIRIPNIQKPDAQTVIQF